MCISLSRDTSWRTENYWIYCRMWKTSSHRISASVSFHILYRYMSCTSKSVSALIFTHQITLIKCKSELKKLVNIGENYVWTSKCKIFMPDRDFFSFEMDIKKKQNIYVLITTKSTWSSNQIICGPTIVMNCNRTIWSFKCQSNQVMIRQLMGGYIVGERELKKVQGKKSMRAIICK